MQGAAVRAWVLAALVCGAATGAAQAEGVLYFPPDDGDWATVSPEEAGWDAEKLEAALAYAGEHDSSGVVILHRGRILAERHWDNENFSERYKRMLVDTTDAGHAIEDVASAQKSVVSFLAAVARDRGLLGLDHRVSNYLEVGWSDMHRDREHEITLQQLMSMSSGMTTRLAYEAEHATRWRYNTNAYSMTVPVLEVAADSDIHTLTREWLTARIGMNDSRWARREWLVAGQDANTIGFATSARDLARFGLLMLAEGEWSGTALVEDKELVREMFKPSQRMNPAYGLLWWLNGSAHYIASNGLRHDGPLIPTGPDDMVAAMGALERKCYVVPSLDLVVTRLGDASSGFNTEFWALLSDAAPSK